MGDLLFVSCMCCRWPISVSRAHNDFAVERSLSSVGAEPLAPTISVSVTMGILSEHFPNDDNVIRFCLRIISGYIIQVGSESNTYEEGLTGCCPQLPMSLSLPLRT